MWLTQLNAENFRLYPQLSLPFTRRLNLFVGANAVGKTSVLEAIYTLARAKSFRGSSSQELLGADAEHWLLFGKTREKTEHGETPGHTLGVRWQGGSTELRCDGQSATALDLLDALSVQVIEPSMHRLLEDGPTYRRSFVDWGVFHVEPSFLMLWRRYKRALKQRNQALRLNRPETEIAAWEPELVFTGEEIDRLRRAHLDGLEPLIRSHLQKLVGESAWAFDWHAGWAREIPLAQVLEQQRMTDRKVATTQSGPHRAELKIKFFQHGARYRISRGQQKMLVAALILAQCEIVAEKTARYPIILLDDFEAELATPFQNNLIQALQAYAGQVFITAFEHTAALQKLDDLSVFHVEHRQINPAIE
ncbi:DNA replication/repair protein RecF [Sinimarinibacterium sp. NLF-5-8]|uniref:DNA replication/repair protein RecF n=1 Tax=Sinimarinibacterium sp. NLF-5-8 TaxID=2698684 RepID=UPI00137BF130|nr:DNA replication/repair protein RecF [Sinimarinibacterium sp. NLF-5-8]QHS10708.1 DNA replication/repair protein RecF [Sinimarinibacterium sp. NLF-5-8]